MIERAAEIEAMVGERETLAMAQHRPRQAHTRDAVDDLGFDRNQMLEVELVRHFEERSVMVTALALGMVQRPGGILGERGDLGRRRLDLELRTDQLAHTQCESQFPRFQAGGLERQTDIRRDCGAIERRRRFGLDGACDVALHEEPLAVVERRQRGVACAQRRRLGRDTEQRPDEVLERPRQLDQQVGFVLCREPVGRGAGRQQAPIGVGIGVLQPGHEDGVQSRQSLAIVEVVEAEPEGDRWGQRGRDHLPIIRGNSLCTNR